MKDSKGGELSTRTYLTQLPVSVKQPRTMQIVFAGWLGRDGPLMMGLVEGGFEGLGPVPAINILSSR